MKLIDADALKANLVQKMEYSTPASRIIVMAAIDAMPDAGCARGQRTTQYCADLEACMRERDEWKRKHDELSAQYWELVG